MLGLSVVSSLVLAWLEVGIVGVEKGGEGGKDGDWGLGRRL